jgi:small subunit ribosomal protein S14
MSQFRAKKLDIGCFTKIRNIRDHTKRKVYAEHEPERYAPADMDEAQTGASLTSESSSQALRYIIRNTTFPQRVRAQAQLQLSQMHCYTRFTQIKNRCIMGGKGRGVFSDFRMGRVRITPCISISTSTDLTTVPIPVERACWKSAWRKEGKLVVDLKTKESRSHEPLQRNCKKKDMKHWHWAALGMTVHMNVANTNKISHSYLRKAVATDATPHLLLSSTFTYKRDSWLQLHNNTNDCPAAETSP